MDDMRLAVVKYALDESRSLDCILCDENDNTNHFTVINFYCRISHNSFTICPEHLDSLVTQALKRHKEALDRKDPFWYLEEDKDPWQE